jgi:tryptophan synthase alpha subunit
VIEHLQNQLNWIEQENIESPYIYLTYVGECSEKDAKEFVDKLKGESNKNENK